MYYKSFTALNTHFKIQLNTIHITITQYIYSLNDDDEGWISMQTGIS